MAYGDSQIPVYILLVPRAQFWILPYYTSNFDFKSVRVYYVRGPVYVGTRWKRSSLVQRAQTTPRPGLPTKHSWFIPSWNSFDSSSILCSADNADIIATLFSFYFFSPFFRLYENKLLENYCPRNIFLFSRTQTRGNVVFFLVWIRFRDFLLELFCKFTYSILLLFFCFIIITNI